jgi:hypothetical protein
VAIQKPYGISLNGVTIDASEANTISWSTSGDISTAFAINIYKNFDGTLAWSLPKTNSYAISYNLPSGSLINGIEYKVQVTIYNSNNNSSTSDFYIFQTSSRPVVTVPTIGTVNSQSYLFTASYSQAESVSLKSWIAYLYDSNQNLINQSPLTITSTLEYLFGGLNSGKTYYVEFQSTSNKGLTGTSGKISFTTSFTQPNLTTNIIASNVENAGVNLSWYVTQITGTSTNANFVGGEKLDVTNGSATFNQGFSIENDFTLKLWIESVTNYQFTTNTDVIVSNTVPSNINAIWIVDSTKTTPQSTSFVESNVAPTNTNNLWIVNSSQTTPRNLGAIIDTTQPTDTTLVWVNSFNPKNGDFELLRLVGNNGTITLEYFNGAFNLFTIVGGVKTLLETYAVNGNSYYLYIQQIGDAFNLSAQALT